MLNDFLSQFWPSTFDGLAAGAIYALIALGYTMVYGVLRLINFAHSEIFMIGTFAALLTLNLLGISGVLGGFQLVAVLVLLAVAAALASGLSAMLLERVAYRPLRRRGGSRLAALISAIGASLFLSELFALVVIPWVFDMPQRGRDFVAFPRLFEKQDLFVVFGHGIRNDKLLIFVAALVMMVALDQFVNRTRIGRGVRATAQDPQTAVLMGVNIDRVVSITFLAGGLMAGIAAMLYVVQFETTRFNIGFILGIKAFTAAVMGGIGNLRGALVGGLVLGLVENYGASLVGSEWKDVIAFVILVVVLMFRPTGILGESLQQARV